MGRTSPVVAQFEFAARVRKRREELGLPAATVSKHCGFTRNFYSAVENSRSLLATAKLPLLIEALQFDEADAQTLTTLLDEARTPGWWQPHASLFDDNFVQFLGLEYGAVKIRSYESLVFNGLLQSPEYAAAIIDSSLNSSPVEKKRILEIRLKRQQEILDRGPQPQMQFMFGEALLYQQFGPSDVLATQLRHLLELANRFGSNLDMRVRPFSSTPVGLASASTLVLLDFTSEWLGPALYMEAVFPIAVITDPAMVERLNLHYEQALSFARDRNETLELIAERVRGLS